MPSMPPMPPGPPAGAAFGAGFSAISLIGKSPVPGLSSRARAAALGAGGAEPATAGAARGDLVALIQELTDQMHAAAAELQFEVAARLRDEIKELKHELRGMHAAGV